MTINPQVSAMQSQLWSSKLVEYLSNYPLSRKILLSSSTYNFNVSVSAPVSWQFSYTLQSLQNC